MIIEKKWCEKANVDNNYDYDDDNDEELKKKNKQNVLYKFIN